MRYISPVILSGCLVFGTPIRADVFDINTPAYISCVTDESAELITIGDYEGDNPGDKLRAQFFKWVFDKTGPAPKARLDFIWQPKTDVGPRLKIMSHDESYHTMVAVRSKTKNSMVAVSSTSEAYTVISWMFTFNFNLKTLLATQLQSGVANLRGKVMTFNCQFGNWTGSELGGRLAPLSN